MKKVLRSSTRGSQFQQGFWRKSNLLPASLGTLQWKKRATKLTDLDMDASKRTIHLKNLNKYSWLLLITFIFAVFAMSYQTANTSFDGFIQTLPLIIIFVFWSEKSAQLIKQTESNLKKVQLFNRDIFILSFSFLLGFLISLLFAYDNSDAKAWWVLIIYFISMHGLIFSLIFSAIALLIKNHKAYTLASVETVFKCKKNFH